MSTAIIVRRLQLLVDSWSDNAPKSRSEGRSGLLSASGTESLRSDLWKGLREASCSCSGLTKIPRTIPASDVRTSSVLKPEYGPKAFVVKSLTK